MDPIRNRWRGRLATRKRAGRREDGRADSRADKQADKQAGRQVGRLADRQAVLAVVVRSGAASNGRVGSGRVRVGGGGRRHCKRHATPQSAARLYGRQAILLFATCELLNMPYDTPQHEHATYVFVCGLTGPSLRHHSHHTAAEQSRAEAEPKSSSEF